MKFLAITCKVLGYIWVVLAGILFLVSIVGIWMKEGFSGVQHLLSPFDMKGYFTITLTFAPGIGLLMLAEKLKNKVQAKNPKSQIRYPKSFDWRS